MSINLTFLLIGLILIGIGLFLKDLKRLFISNSSVMKKESKRYKNNFSGNDAINTRRTVTCGTRLEIDKTGSVIIQPESRLSLDSYI